MWTVVESKAASKAIDKAQTQIQERYEFWKNVVINSGPEGLRAFSGFHDHALTGQWKDYRSSYLSESHRVICKFARDVLTVHVAEMTHHDYRRKR